VIATHRPRIIELQLANVVCWFACICPTPEVDSTF
jgi:hypothetical protein